MLPAALDIDTLSITNDVRILSCLAGLYAFCPDVTGVMTTCIDPFFEILLAVYGKTTLTSPKLFISENCETTQKYESFA